MDGYIQTYTAEEEAEFAAMGSAVNDQQYYEQVQRDVYCVACGTHSRATTKHLSAMGWWLENDNELCPRCGGGDWQ